MIQRRKEQGMKKKMIILVIIMIVVFFFAGWYFMFSRLGIGPAFPFLPSKELELEGVEMGIAAEDQLMALTETKEEAENIAQLYGIELISFSEGVATYRTEEEPREVIARGQENGYPQLYLNYVRTAD